MRREAGLGVLVLVGALALPIVGATPVVIAASPATITGGPASGPIGTALSYSYFWDATDCTAVPDGDTIYLTWDTGEPIGTGTVNNATPGTTDCTGNVTGVVPNDATGYTGHVVTATVGGGTGVPESGASTNFTLTPPPTPRPTPPPTPRPTPRPTPTQAPPPTATPKPTPPPTPTPKPLPTPPPFIGGGGGGGSGGGSPEGGAACSGGIGLSPTSTELSNDIAQIVQGTDPTTVQIGILASDAYYQKTGGTDLDFVNRLYDDVLRHDPTPVEVSIGLSMLAGAGEAGRSQLAEAVVLSPEARAIRVDQAFHTLLDTYPSSAELAIWVNRLAGVNTKGISDNTMVEEVAASGAYFTLVGSKGATFIDKLYQALLSRSPTATELKDDASLIASAASVTSRLALAEKVVSSTEFLSDQVISFYANYLHPTCPAIAAQECAGVPGTPSAAELSAALTALAGTSTEEDIIAGVLASPQYYANHGSTQTGLVDGVYQDLFGRAPTNAEVTAALDKYPNDPLGDSEFVQSMVSSSVYMDLVVSLDYQQFLLRAPLPTETTAGVGVLGGDIPSLQTPDQTLLEQIVATPEYLADAGGTPSRFVVRTIETLLMQAPTTEQTLTYLSEPLPHTSSWQSGVVTSIVDSPMYETDFVRGVYAKFLTYRLCPTTGPVTTSTGDIGFLKEVPGGWFGLGVMVGVLLMGAGAAVFFTLERRRFARIYPDEVPRHHI